MKVLAAELIPNLLLWAVLIGIFWSVRSRGLNVLALLLLLAAMPVVPKTLMALWVPETQDPATLQIPENSVVMVFGGGIAGSEAGYFPKAGSLRRALTGVELATRYDLPLFFSGGVSLKDAPSEAEVMLRYLRALGYRGELIADDTALNTWENALATQALLKERGFQAVIAVTDADHARRAWASLKAADVAVAAFVVPSPVPDGPAPYTDFIPRSGGLSAWTRLGHEVVGSIVYILRGRMSLSQLF